MRLILFKQNLIYKIKSILVPTRNLLFSLLIKIFCILLFANIQITQAHLHRTFEQHRHILKSSHIEPSISFAQGRNHFRAATDFNDVAGPTRPIESVTHHRDITHHDHTRARHRRHYHHDLLQKNIQPSKVLYHEHYVTTPYLAMLSSAYNLQSVDPYLSPSGWNPVNSKNELPPEQPKDSQSGGIDVFDPGSGFGSDLSNMNDPNPMLEESIADSSAMGISPTPVQASGTIMTYPVQESGNRPPILSRKIPKLVLKSGRYWRYNIPADTFVDEDGDLRQLRTMITSYRERNESNDIETQDYPSDSFNQFDSWLIYDQGSQTFYGLPTDQHAGRHVLSLVVSDKWGAMSEEIIEIIVRRHHSSRAQTHQVNLNGISWSASSFSSAIEVVHGVITRLCQKLYSDAHDGDILVRHFSMIKLPPGPHSGSSALERGYINIGWSNTSLPAYPCNMTMIEDMYKPMVDILHVRIGWLIDREDKLAFPPSQNLTQILGSDLKVSNVSIKLEGACLGHDMDASNNVQPRDDTTGSLHVRFKIGKVTYKLGQPIEYKLPEDIFEIDNYIVPLNDLELQLHTIEALPLDKDERYRFLDFEADNKTIYGLPYDYELHSGQKELILTATHTKSKTKAREAFIIDIQPPDLTTLNNRAFQMSLYFSSRSGLLGPQERTAVCHKIVSALRGGDPNFYHESSSEMVVTDLNRFVISTFGGHINYQAISSAFAGKIVMTDDAVADSTDSAIVSGNSVHSIYKLSWTNETIGDRGDCPVEVIKEHILYALEEAVLDLRESDPITISPVEEMAKNDSTRFYERLRTYFEPESDLIHLRFEPLGACLNALELHDVGNSEFADLIDKSGGHNHDISLELNAVPAVVHETPKQDNAPNPDEYWSIIVLIVLVMALIFVIVMFVMGMHTYKVNQDKKFELQIRLAQARQNSMYLSSMILANQANGANLTIERRDPNVSKSMYVVLDDDKGTRKPVIIDDEKQILSKTQSNVRMGNIDRISVSNFNGNCTLESIATANWQQPYPMVSMNPTIVYGPDAGDKYRSATLNRRTSSTATPLGILPVMNGNIMNHSHSIMAMNPISTPLPMIAQTLMAQPMLYSQMQAQHPGHVQSDMNDMHSGHGAQQF